MKRVVCRWSLAVGLVILLSYPQMGCTKETDSQISTEPQEKEKPEDSNTWDFGQVKEGEILKHNFKLKNESEKILNIKDVNTSCGCTVSKIEKRNLLPGEDTLIEVGFDSKGYSGSTQQFIYVHTDDIDASTSLSINGERSRTIDNPIIRYIIKAEVVKNSPEG